LPAQLCNTCLLFYGYRKAQDMTGQKNVALYTNFMFLQGNKKFHPDIAPVFSKKMPERFQP
jgi:hypothetical protein